jgi:glycosyltransferase involved in cell wall biosynthesis
MKDTVRVYVITYRRPKLLERALRSIVSQTHADWTAEVLNDDPTDSHPAELIKRIGDSRIRLSTPCIHRGGVGNFNYAFRSVEEPYASILEDDNWWEPEFLATMLACLKATPACALACGNERIWSEQSDGSFLNTGLVVWPKQDGLEIFTGSAAGRCAHPKFCNSSLFFHTTRADEWKTPAEIPLDYTEHFRERVIPLPLLLVFKPLVNYASTITSYRLRNVTASRPWETALVGSIFAMIPPQRGADLAAVIWRQTRKNTPLFAIALLTTGRIVPEASELWRQGTLREKLRFYIDTIRRPGLLDQCRATTSPASVSWQFLCQGPFAEALVRGDIPN